MTLEFAENTSKRRDKLVIIAEIIQIAEKGTSKTHIMFKANLSFSQLNQYLTVLTDKCLLEKHKVDGKEIYEATPKGLDLLKKQYEIINLINANYSKYNIKTSLEFVALPRNGPF